MSKEASDFFDNEYFWLNKFYLTAIGRWPYQKKKQRILFSSSIIIGILTVVIPEVIYFIEVLKDISKMIACLMALIVTYGAYVMIFNSIITFDQMKEILDNIRQNWSSIKNKDELIIFKKYAREGKILIIIYSVLVLSSVCTFVLVGLIPKIIDIISPSNNTEPIKNLLEVEYFVDPDKYYTLIYIHGTQAALFVVFIIVSIDTYFVMIIQHACSMFVVLGDKLGKVSHRNTQALDILSDDKRDIIIHNQLIECIKYHWDCIRFSDLIEESFTISYLLQLFINMIGISSTGAQTIMGDNEPQEMFSFGLNTLSIVVRLFYVSYTSQKLLNHSEEVHTYLTQIAWYDFPPRAKRLIFIMILRSSRPNCITAGSMVPMNFETYAALMKTSMSFFTMILSTQ